MSMSHIVSSHDVSSEHPENSPRMLSVRQLQHRFGVDACGVVVDDMMLDDVSESSVVIVISGGDVVVAEHCAFKLSAV